MFDTDSKYDEWGALAVENAFLADFLPAAKGDQVKVYLYCLYLSRRPGEECGFARLSRELGMPEEDIAAALRYWERRGLVTRLTDDPPSYEFHSAARMKQRGGAPFSVDNEFVEFSENVYSIFGSRRKVSPEEIAHAYEWVADLGLPAEVVLMLINHLISVRGLNFSFRASDRFAVALKEEKIASAEDADAYFRRDDAARTGCRRVLRAMGKRRDASEAELELYAKWTAEWGFDADAVLAACGQMTAGDPSFAYLDGILARLHGEKPAEGETVEDALNASRRRREDAREVLRAAGLEKRLTVNVFEPIYDQLLTVYDKPVILLAAKECATKSRDTEGRVEKLQQLLESWKKRGLSGAEDVEEYMTAFREQNTFLRSLFEKMDMSASPTAEDREKLLHWRSLGYDDELIAFAAEQSRGVTGNKLRYMEKVLETWYEAGIREISQAKAQTPPARKDAPAGGKRLNAQKYDQREYTPEQMDALQAALIQEVLKKDE